MSTAERQIPGNGEERSSNGLTGQKEVETSPQPTPGLPWYHRVSLWRSVAGMAIAIALGCVAIALETATELSRRSAYFHQRLEFLDERIARLRSETADAERQFTAALRAAQLAHANVNRVLSAPDLVLLRLAPGADRNARGLVAISRQTGDAILEVSGLTGGAGHATVMWWLLAKRPPVRAAAFYPDADGRRSLTVQIPPRGAKIAGVVITLEPEKSPDKPNGKIMLRGLLPKPQFLS
jgi:hypothetical protein